MTEPSKIQMLINELGDTPDEVANTLRGWQIQAPSIRGGGDCPIATYLQLRGVEQAWVGRQQINHSQDWMKKDDKAKLADHTAATAEFVRNYDFSSRYQDLKAKP